MMSKQKGRQAGSRIVSVVSGVSFLKKRRTGYGMPERIASLIEMCRRRTTTEAAARNLGTSKGVPAGRRFRDAVPAAYPVRAEFICGEM